MNSSLRSHMSPVVNQNSNGTITISTILNNQRIHCLYSGYTTKQALSLFKSHCKEV